MLFRRCSVRIQNEKAFQVEFNRERINEQLGRRASPLFAPRLFV